MSTEELTAEELSETEPRSLDRMQATIARYRGDVRASRELFAQALAAHKALGNESGIALVLGNMAELEFADGHPEKALQAASEALEIDLRGKNATRIAVSHINIAAYHLALGDFTAARDSAREGLRVARQARHEQVIATALQHLVLLAGLGGDARRAAQLLGHVDAQYATLGMQREPTEQWGYDKLHGNAARAVERRRDRKARSRWRGVVRRSGRRGSAESVPRACEAAPR